MEIENMNEKLVNFMIEATDAYFKFRLINRDLLKLIQEVSPDKLKEAGFDTEKYYSLAPHIAKLFLKSTQLDKQFDDVMENHPMSKIIKEFIDHMEEKWSKK